MAAEETAKEKKPEEKKKAKPREYNPLWKGYLFILLSSLINLCAASNVHHDYSYTGIWGVSVMFGCVTFALSFLILFFDRTGLLIEKLGDFRKAHDGKLEGWVLGFFIAWWIAGVGYQTSVHGIAYLANNVYFSAWMCLASSVYTLNAWSTEKDILSIKEITGISETLPCWYLLLFASLVVTGTSINMLFKVSQNNFVSEAVLGLALGVASIALSLFWILVHYNFIEVVKEGGWAEVTSSFVAILLWIVGVSVMTQEGAIAATLVGSGCRNVGGVHHLLDQNTNCTVNYVDDQGVWHEEWCTILENQMVPGSNLYSSAWMCLGSSVGIAFKWKKQQAQNFAQAQQNKAAAKPKPKEAISDSVRESEGGANDAESEDLDDFQDADDY